MRIHQNNPVFFSGPICCFILSFNTWFQTCREKILAVWMVGPFKKITCLLLLLLLLELVWGGPSIYFLVCISKFDSCSQFSAQFSDLLNIQFLVPLHFDCHCLVIKHVVITKRKEKIFEEDHLGIKVMIVQEGLDIKLPVKLQLYLI